MNIKKPNIDWLKVKQHLWQGAKVYLTVTLVLVAVVGTYGVYLLKNTPVMKPDQMAQVWESPAGQIQAQTQSVADIEKQTAEQEQMEAQTQTVPPPVAKAAEAAIVPAVEPVTVPLPVPEPEPEPEMVDPSSIKALSPPCSGTISRRFGISLDPLYGDYRYNDGIDYSLTEADKAVRAAANGTVESVNEGIDGYTVTIAHQAYKTIYQNLTSTTVTQGQQLVKGDQLGALDTVDGLLHFAVETNRTVNQ